MKAKVALSWLLTCSAMIWIWGALLLWNYVPWACHGHWFLKIRAAVIPTQDWAH